MITTVPFSFIHTRGLVPSEGPMATPIFAISRQGEEGLKLLTGYGLAKNKIAEIKRVFEGFQKEILNHFRTSSTPLASEDNQKTYTIYLFSEKESFLLLTRPLGQGAFKKVYPGVDLVTGKLIAAFYFQRIFGPLRSKFDYDPYKEIAILASQRGVKNLLSLEKVFGYRIPDTRGFIDNIVLTRLYRGGSLFDGRLNPSLLSNRCSAAFQIVKGLIHIHNRGAFHGDIKFENIFWEINEEGDLELAIGDFGAYMDLCDIEKRRCLLTSLWYNSPDCLAAVDAQEDLALAKLEMDEVAAKKSTDGNALISFIVAQSAFERSQFRYEALQEFANDRPLDVWSVGVVFYYLFCGQLPPWILYAENRNSAKSILKYIDEVAFKPLPSGEVSLLNVPPTQPPEIGKLIQRMLVLNDADRLTIHEVYQELIAIDKSGTC